MAGGTKLVKKISLFWVSAGGEGGICHPWQGENVPSGRKNRELDLGRKHLKEFSYALSRNRKHDTSNSLQEFTSLWALMSREGNALGSSPVLRLPVAVVMVFVIAAQSCQASQTNCIRKEDLSACIHPDLQGRCKHK